MSYLGKWEIDDLLTFSVTTHTFATGALTDADSVPSYRVYEDETGTAILTGSMAKLDDTNTTGHYSGQLTLSAANGFEVGKAYSIYITAAVSSVTGGATRSFQVEAAPATASALQTVDDLVDDLESRLTSTRAGYLDNLSAGAVALEATAQSILTDTAEIGTAGAGLTAAGLTAANVRTAVGLASANLDTQLDALPTNAELATALGTADDATLAAIAALNNLSAAQVNTEVDTALFDVGVTTTVTGRIDAAISSRGTGTALDAAGVRTAVGLATANLDTQLADVPTNAELATALGTADDAVLAAVAALNNLSQAQVRTAIGLASANLDTQLADLPTVAEFEARTIAAASYFDPAVDAVTVGTIQTDAITAAAIATAAAQEIADVILARGVGNIEASAAEHSLATIILAALESSMSSTTWTIKRTDGSTTHVTKTLTLDAAADPITAVA